MTNNVRIFLWVALGLAIYLNFMQWSHDYAPKPVAQDTAAAGASKSGRLEDTVPQAQQSTAPTPASTSDAVPSAAATPADAVPAQSDHVVRVTTDVLVLDIDLKGGTFVRAELPTYPVKKGKSDPVVLFNRDDPSTEYLLETGLSGDKPGEARPTHLANFTSTADRFQLAAGQDELRVPLTWTDGQGVTVTKTFVFHRGLFVINLEYAVDNKSAAPWVLHSYARIVRTDPAVESSMFNIESRSFRGPAMWAPAKLGEKNTFKLTKIEKFDGTQPPSGVQHGWIAAMQHHFVSVIVPDDKKKYNFSLEVHDRQYRLAALGPAESVAPNSTGILKETLFVGPKLQKQLTLVHPELDRVAEYGLLTILSRPLFMLLEFLHSLVKNWGVSIILATFLLKLLFYPLQEKSGRSMAKMRELAPRMKQLQETYKDDRAKLGQATMELYRQEKVNPVSGCLPMLIQMPVFFAFYYVLLESVEMRQAPFILWINDLSSRDPYFILPALNGLAMWMQYKLNPPPPDPMQAKIFQFMPLVFSVMFAFFPAGLVIYWVTNTGLSILQQWNINRKIHADKTARAR